MNREDFLMLNKDIVYFDNGATTLKPKVMIDATIDYYANYTANAHRGDYDISLKVDNNYENTRLLVKEFINADSTKEIVFTSGATDSLNRIVFGYFQNTLKENDEVIITKSEHASNVLPWFELAKRNKIKIKYIELTSDYKVTIDNLKKVITPNTKVISLAHVTNVIGDVRPIKEISALAHENNILLVVDGAQSVPHIAVDVKEMDIDFLAFSAHKMCGPTGVGVLYGKYELLDKLKPTVVGGGMNSTFSSDLESEYNSLPHRLEAGTPNIAGVIAFGKVISYLNNIGMDKIHKYELELKDYALSRLKENKNIIIYNENAESGIIAINYKDVFAQDLAIYLNKYNICVRAGNHCAKILKEEINVKNTCRISFYLYNTKEEIDRLIDALSNENIKNELI
ncbi:MAG: cysteine desulfurase [Bacillales bacterium]|nr:cysteine desulfurase [Bacillales bacterium]